jgi:protein tyrosine phosphatase (PTP) superfamily phosphohydrolase (DUF442 family)
MNIIGQIYQTKDYHLFKSIEGNREINPVYLNKLRKSMKKNYLFTVIIVNEKHEIIDGQHRFEIIKEFGLPMNFTIRTGYGLNEVHILNANAKIWNADDYLSAYCDKGTEHYMVYKNFKDNYGFGHSECMRLLSGASSNQAGFFKFKSGDFKVLSLHDAITIAENILLLKPYYDGYKRRAFVFSMIKLHYTPNFNFSEFLNKLKTQRLRDCSDVTSYIAHIEEVYNFHRKNKVNLRFQ